MEQSEFVKEKMAILNHIISINDAEELKQIKEYILSIHIELARNEESLLKNFEKWNEQFTDSRNLNEPIDEFGVMLGNYRKMIYEAELSESFPLEEFQQKLKSIYNEP